MINTDKTLLLHYNVDSEGNPTSIKIDNEQKKISSVHYAVQLHQVPDEAHRMVVVDDLGNELIEVYNMDEIKENNYYINYTSSVVWFHPSKAGKTFIFNYHGLGIELIGASRIYDESSINGQFIVKTIQEIIDKGRECIEALSTIGDAVKLLQRIENYIIVATELDIALKEDIAIGQPLLINLNTAIEEGKQLDETLNDTIDVANTSKTNLETATTNANNKKIELEGTISTANTSKTNLENASATADAKKTELDTSIANAQDDINTINSAGNRTYTVPSTAWVGTEPNLSYILEHNLGGENLVVGVIDNDTKLSSVPDYKSIDSMKIELYSTTRRSVTVTINKSAYTGSDSEWVSQEVIDARKGEISLGSRLDGVDSQLADIAHVIKDKTYSDLLLKMIKGEAVNIVCYGDSLTYGYTPSTGVQTPNPYPLTLQTKLREYYNNVNITVFNEGISGATSTQLATNETIANVTSHSPDLVILMVGVNDNNSDAVDVQLYQENLFEIIKKISPTPIMLLTPTPYIREWHGTEYYTKDRAMGFVQAVKEVALKTNSFLINTYDIVKNDVEYGNRNYSFLGDNLHFFDEYYQRFATFVFAFGLCNDDVIIDDNRQIVCNNSLWRLSNGVTVNGTSSKEPNLRAFVIKAGQSIEIDLFIDKAKVSIDLISDVGTSTGAEYDQTLITVNGVSINDVVITTEGYNTPNICQHQVYQEITKLGYGLHTLKIQNNSPVWNLAVSGIRIRVSDEKIKLPERTLSAKTDTVNKLETLFTGSFKQINPNTANYNFNLLGNFGEPKIGKKIKVTFTPIGGNIGIGLGTQSFRKKNESNVYEIFYCPQIVIKNISANTAVNVDVFDNGTSGTVEALSLFTAHTTSNIFNLGAENVMILEFQNTGILFDINGNSFLVGYDKVHLGTMDIYTFCYNANSSVEIIKVDASI